MYLNVLVIRGIQVESPDGFKFARGERERAGPIWQWIGRIRRDGTEMGERILIFDTTLRDGEQSPGCSMNLEEKLRMAGQLEALGVDVIEAGFPIASDDDFAAVREVAKTCRRPIIAALCRTTPEDIERAWEALSYAARPRIHTFVATSDIHLQYKLQKNREEVLEMSCKAVRLR